MNDDDYGYDAWRTSGPDAELERERRAPPA